ncbi:MAG: hypothetical protein B6244_05950 [Candidatus Cloacimonetes bacterium 4572_55]|nr:MAG: hypothetical protein B6244_05950 [Candidatus Cloacimonetes bacterium 4572_55]
MRVFNVIAASILFCLLMPKVGSAEFHLKKGFLVSANHTRLSGDTPEQEDIEARTGFSAGMAVQFHFSRKIALQSEILYSRKGGKSSAGATYLDSEESTTWRVDYLELPILIKYKFPSNGIAQPNLYFGGAVDLTIDKEKRYKDADGEFRTTGWDNVKKTDAGLIFGADLNFDVGTGLLIFDFRYVWGMLNILESPEDAKNGVISLGIGYLF